MLCVCVGMHVVSAVCVSVVVAVVVVVVCVCAVWCGTLKTPVCRFTTSPCVPAPRAHVRVVPVHTRTF